MHVNYVRANLNVLGRKSSIFRVDFAPRQRRGAAIKSGDGCWRWGSTTSQATKNRPNSGTLPKYIKLKSSNVGLKTL